MDILLCYLIIIILSILLYLFIIRWLLHIVVPNNIALGFFILILSSVSHLDTESGKQPSISMSQDCSSLDSSTIGPRGGGDGDSHASLIPGPRSCTVSIASSFDNFNINNCDGFATTSSIAEAMVADDIVEQTSVTNISHHGSTVDKDSLSVLESVGSNEDD